MASEQKPPGEVMLTCTVCLTDIPKSVALTQEGEEYFRYFCGNECYEEWLAAPEIETVSIAISGTQLDFDTARALAERVAAREVQEPMLLGWWDRERKQASPVVPECQYQPGWLVYAKSHGGGLQVDVNHGAYLFVYREGR